MICLVQDAHQRGFRSGYTECRLIKKWVYAVYLRIPSTTPLVDVMLEASRQSIKVDSSVQPLIHIRSDNGTNLIGAKKELHDSLATWGQDRDLGLPWSRDVSGWKIEL